MSKSSLLAVDYLSYNGRSPDKSLIDFMHQSLPDEHSRCTAVAALVLGLWQLSGRDLSPQPPSCLLVNAGTDPDPVFKFMQNNRGLEMLYKIDPEKAKARRQTMVAFSQKRREAFPLRDERALKWLELAGPLYKQAKEDAFTTGRCGRYSVMWDRKLGLVTDQSGSVVLWLEDEVDHAAFREHAILHPDHIVAPVGLNEEMFEEIKTACVFGSLTPSQWDAELIHSALEGLPILFLPHSTQDLPSFCEETSLLLIAKAFAVSKKARVPLCLAWCREDSDLRLYEQIIRRRLRNLPGPYEFLILRTLRELLNVCAQISFFVARDRFPNDLVGAILADLMAMTVRAIAIGSEALAYRGFGVEFDGTYDDFSKLMEFLRSGPKSRREITRRFKRLEAAQRDRILESLERQGLVRLTDNQVEATSLAEFIREIPGRCGFPPLKLLTTLPAAAASRSRGS